MCKVKKKMAHLTTLERFRWNLTSNRKWMLAKKVSLCFSKPNSTWCWMIFFCWILQHKSCKLQIYHITLVCRITYSYKEHVLLLLLLLTVFRSRTHLVSLQNPVVVVVVVVVGMMLFKKGLRLSRFILDLNEIWYALITGWIFDMMLYFQDNGRDVLLPFSAAFATCCSPQSTPDVTSSLYALRLLVH